MTRSLRTYGSENVARAVGRYAGNKISELQSLYLRRSGVEYHDALAALATLRRGESLSPWMQVGNMFLATLFDGWDETALGSLDIEPQQAVIAYQTALQLYATHQRSKSEGVYARQSFDDTGKGGKPFGAACYELTMSNKRSKGDSSNDAVARRMAVVDSVSDFPGMVRGTRSLITMMRSADCKIALDYGSLAYDLYLMQFPGSKPSVMRQWAGDYYHAKLVNDIANGNRTKGKKNLSE